MTTETPAVRDARNRRQNRRRAAIADGTWQPPFVDAEPVRNHMASLRDQGVTLKRIAKLSKVPWGTVTGLTYGANGYTQQVVRREIAAAILAVRPTWKDVADEAFVPGIGTTRRLQALVAVGFPAPYLATRLGMFDTYMNKILRGERPRITARLARSVAALYDELWNVEPLSLDILPVAKSRAQSRARRHDGSLPAAWDDDLIDDPNARPSAGQDVPRYVAHAENCLELERQGHTREQISQRLGVTRDTLQRALFLYRRQQARRAA
jgi:transcriptional regulator with XRE-family HTH domain